MSGVWALGVWGPREGEEGAVKMREVGGMRAPLCWADAQGAGLGGGLWGWEALGPEAEEHEVIHPF